MTATPHSGPRAAMFGAVALLPLLALLAAAPLRAQQPFTRGRAVEPGAAVRVHSMAGTVTVEGWDRDSVHVSGTVGAGLTPYSGGARTYFKVTTYEGEQDPQSASHLVLRVPRRAQLWVKTTSASVTVRGVDGSVELNTIDGAVAVTGAPDELSVASMRGAVRVDARAGWVRIRTGTGDVDVRGAARDLAVSTVSGRIASTTRFARGRLESVRGDIVLAGPLAAAATADVDSHAGAVTLRVGPRASAAFTVYTVTGSIVNELSAARPRETPGTGRELAFVTGEGAARVTVRTFQGAVALRVR